MGAEILLEADMKWPVFAFDRGYAGVCYSLDELAVFAEPLAWEEMDVFDADLRRLSLREPQHPAVSRPDVQNRAADSEPERFEELARLAISHHGHGGWRRVARADIPGDVDSSELGVDDLKSWLATHFRVRP